MTQLKKQPLRNCEYYDMQAIFDALYAKSLEKESFTKLMPIIKSDENILLAYRNIKRNSGSTTPGTDGKTIRDIETIPCDEFIQSVQDMLNWYKPKPVRRVEIPKPNGGMRPLGIPNIWDRIVQQCIKQVLEPICEARFHESSFGFRPNRSPENAISKVQLFTQVQHLHYVVDIDIKGFFDNVNHSKLIKQMWSLGIRDKTLICIIKEMLHAPVLLLDGTVEHPTKGTPQGGILSPLLANIVLNELDWWVSSQWESHPTHKNFVKQYNRNGSENRGNLYRELRKSNLKEMFIVRYADDFKIFCKHRNDANRMFIATKMWLNERLKLEVNDEKSKVTDLKRHYSEFLGFEFKVVPKHAQYVIESHMSSKAIKRETQSLIAQVKNIQRPSDSFNEALAVNRFNAMVLGIHNYYSIATHISKDCKYIQRRVSVCMVNRLRDRLKLSGSMKSKMLSAQYGASKQLRFVGDREVIPVGFVQHRNAMSKNFKANNYTVDGRAVVHKALAINKSIQLALMRTHREGQSIEFIDNRNSKWYAQYGKCAITDRPLSLWEIHCHHIKPRGAPFFGSDAYENLVIVSVDIHRLIHATKADTIAKYLAKLAPTPAQIKKLNKYRKSAGLMPI